MFRKKPLHVGHLGKPLIERSDFLIPHAGAAFFNSGYDGVGIYDLLHNVRHELIKDARM